MTKDTKLTWSLYLNAVAIVIFFIFRFTFNETVNYFIVFGLILMVLFVLYGILKRPTTYSFITFSVVFNIYAIVTFILIALYHSTNWFDTFEKSSIIILLTFALPIFGIISSFIVLLSSRLYKK